MYVQVSIPISSFKTFTYCIKKKLVQQISLGQSVTVLFRNKLTNGFIISINSKSKFKGKILEIRSININSFHISNELWKTINWISQYYICSLGKTLHATIPYQHIKNLNLNSIQKVEITNLGKDTLTSNLIKYPNQKKILQFLNSNNDILYPQLKNICTSFRATCKRLESLKFIKISQINKQSVEGIKKINKYNLTTDQGAIAKKISKEWNSNKKPVLLSGVSGSGKTMVYIDLIKSVILKNKSIIVLVPEIALIAGAYNVLDKFFPDSVVPWHSKMKQIEKKHTLNKIKNNQGSIVVSTRSGLFLPFNNLGLIVVDEEQESSYKQDSKSPYYHARDVAIMRAKFSCSNIILISSSPSLESYLSCKNKNFSIYKLKDRFNKYKLPDVTIINMKNKENYGKGYGMISRELFDNIITNLKKGKQILLLHNRFGPQIKKFEKLLIKLFPNATVARYDRETIQKNNFYTILNNFHENKINILLGTQMIAKSIDFKNVALVGILNADLGLNLPDFRSDEKLFQLAYQFIGRAGRHSNNSKAIIQTFNPDNIYIQSIHDYNLDKFYNYILEDRKSLFYPPYSRLIRIIVISNNINKIKKESNKIADIFRKNKNLQIIGPSEAPIDKINDNWRYHILIKMNKNYWNKLFNWINSDVGLSLFDNNKKIKLDVDPISFL